MHCLVLLLLLLAVCNQPALSSNSYVAGCTCSNERNSLPGLQGLTTDSTHISWIRSSATFSYVETAALGYGSSSVISSVLTLVGSASTQGASNGSPGTLGNAPPTLCTNASDSSILIADPGNSAVRRAKRSSGFTGTLSSLGAHLPGAYGIAALGDAAFVSLLNSHYIVRYSASSNTSAPFAGDFAGVSYAHVDAVGGAARFKFPMGLAVSTDSAGVATPVYVADSGNFVIRAIDTASAAVTTLAGLPGSAGSVDGLLSAARFTRPSSLAIDTFLSPVHLYVGDSGAMQVRRIDLVNGTVWTLAGTGSSFSSYSSGATSSFQALGHVAVDRTGRVFVTDSQAVVMIKGCSGASPPISTPSGTPSRAATPTPTPSPTPSATGSPSPSPSPSPLPAASPSATPLPSPSRAQTHACTSLPQGCAQAQLTPAGPPLAVLTGAPLDAKPWLAAGSANGSSASGSGPTALTSAGVLQAPVSLALPLAPAPQESLAIVCSATPAAAFALSSASGDFEPCASPPAALCAQLAPGAAGASAPAALLLLLDAAASAPPAAASSAFTMGTLACTLSSSSPATPAQMALNPSLIPNYAPLSTVTLPAAALPVHWPVLSALLLESSVQPGLFSLIGAPSAATAPTTSASSLPALCAPLGFNSSSSGNSSLQPLAWSSPALPSCGPALAALSLAAASYTASATAPTPWLSASLSGSRHLVLAAPPALPFPSTLAVALGGVPCTLNWHTPALASVTTPTLRSLCGTGLAQDCGVMPLLLYTVPPAAFNATPAQPPPPGFYPPAAYPPLLPPPPTLNPLSLGPTLVHAFLTLPTAQHLPYARTLSPPAMGIRATAACSDPAFAPPEQCSALALAYTRGALLATLPAPQGSSAVQQSCAWGSGDACQPCPAGALCPGGTQLLPLPGFWVPRPDAPLTAFLACPPPNPTLRCPGWSSAAAAAAAGAPPGLCGVGYRGSACTACSPAFFLQAGQCAPCPTFSSLTAATAVPPLQFLGGLLALGAAMLLLAHSARRKWGGTVGGSVRAVLSLLLFVWQVAQAVSAMLVQVQASAPPQLFALYSVFAALQFQGVALPAACLSGVTFQGFWACLGLAIGGGGLLAVGVRVGAGRQAPQQAVPLAANAPPVSSAPAAPPDTAALPLKARPSPWQLRRAGAAAAQSSASGSAAAPLPAPPNLFLRLGALLLDLGFGAFVAQFANVLSCSPALPTTLRAYLEMGGADGSTIDLPAGAPPFAELQRASRDALYAVSLNLTGLLDTGMVAVSTLSSDRSLVCREGEHALVWQLACTAVAGFTLGYPLLVLSVLQHPPALQGSAAPTPLARSLADGDMEAPGRAWVKPAGLFLVSLLSLTSALATGATGAATFFSCQALAAAACLALAAVHWRRSPYLLKHAWRGRVTVALLCLAALSAVVACPLFVPPAGSAASAAELPPATAWALGVLPLLLGLGVFLLLLYSWWWALLLEDPRVKAPGALQGRSKGGPAPPLRALTASRDAASEAALVPTLVQSNPLHVRSGRGAGVGGQPAASLCAGTSRGAEGVPLVAPRPEDRPAASGSSSADASAAATASATATAAAAATADVACALAPVPEGGAEGALAIASTAVAASAIPAAADAPAPVQSSQAVAPRTWAHVEGDAFFSCLETGETNWKAPEGEVEAAHLGEGRGVPEEACAPPPLTRVQMPQDWQEQLFIAESAEILAAAATAAAAVTSVAAPAAAATEPRAEYSAAPDAYSFGDDAQCSAAAPADTSAAAAVAAPAAVAAKVAVVAAPAAVATEPRAECSAAPDSLVVGAPPSAAAVAISAAVPLSSAGAGAAVLQAETASEMANPVPREAASVPAASEVTAEGHGSALGREHFDAQERAKLAATWHPFSCPFGADRAPFYRNALTGEICGALPPGAVCGEGIAVDTTGTVLRDSGGGGGSGGGSKSSGTGVEALKFARGLVLRNAGDGGSITLELSETDLIAWRAYGLQWRPIRLEGREGWLELLHEGGSALHWD